MRAPKDPRQELREAIKRHAHDWAEVYMKEPDSELLIRSMLVGIEKGIQRRAGLLPLSENGAYRTPPGLIGRAYGVGLDISEQIPASILPKS
jgi:hypothetical protein